MSKKPEKPTLKMGDETIRIISNDHKSFYVNKDIACVSKVNIQNLRRL